MSPITLRTRALAQLALALPVVLLVALAGGCRGEARSTEPGVVTDSTRLAELRRVTARFQSLDAAKAAGYSTQITPCWAHHSAGGMGYHFGRTALFDATVDLLQPETVIYEPQSGGRMRLVGMEYIVPVDAWQAAGHDVDDPQDAPQLLGQRFARHATLPIFKLHVWLWQSNPSGTFADWNPTVSCQHADSSETF